MHVMSCTVVFDPCAVDLSHMSVRCCFETERESAEYCRVGGCICGVTINQISSLGVVSTSTSTSAASTTSSPFFSLCQYCHRHFSEICGPPSHCTLRQCVCGSPFQRDF